MYKSLKWAYNCLGRCKAVLLRYVVTALWLTCFNEDEDIRRMLDNCDIGKAMAQVIINLNLAQVETENKAAALEGGRSPTLVICRAQPSS